VQREPNEGVGHASGETDPQEYNGTRNCFVHSDEIKGGKQPMTALELKTLLTRKPFVPVRLIMNDGSTHDVLMARTFLVTKDWLELGQPDLELPPPAVRAVRSIPIAEIQQVVEIAPAVAS
jgi:hypothetical protein